MEDRKKELRERAMQLPLDPGVYLMYDSSGKIIYIGKAKALKNRVSQYFGSDRNHGSKVRKMVSCVDRFDYIVTNSEFEALVLECSLIKQHSPKYNILLKDDKGYRYIKITNEPWPRIVEAKQKENDGATYLGPYMSAFAVNQAVDEVQKVFMLPTCTRKFPSEFGKRRPCLNFYIKQCCGVCTGKITAKEYHGMLSEAVEFLKKGSGSTVKELTHQMLEASDNLDFERAAKLRDRIEAIKKLQEKQKVVDEGKEEQDVIAAIQGVNAVCFVVLKYSDGSLFDKKHYIFNGESDISNIRQEFIERYYSENKRIPRKILLDEKISDQELLEKWLSELAGHKVIITVPSIGEKNKLIEMCRENAAEQLKWGQERSAKEISALDELARLLGMKKPPEYIEMYDISNIAGSDNVAGMVVFKNGRPLKSAYRKFKIKTVVGQDDYASMSEVICRRLKEYQASEDETGFGKLPDLILLDGGKGHVSSVEPLIKSFGLEIPVFGVVKDNRHRTRAVSAASQEISIRSYRKAFTLLSQIQDEVHRFAIGYHREQRKKASLHLSLTDIKGVGEKRAKNLLSHFGTIKAIEEASVDDLLKVEGVNRPCAKAVYDHFHKNK